MPEVIISRPILIDGTGYTQTRPTTKSYLIHRFFTSITRFQFPVNPREISFENLSATYEEIARPSNYPLIAFDELSLTRASIEFRLFDYASGGLASVEAQMRTLRNLATAPGIVTFEGVDKMLQEPLQPVSVDGTTTRNQAYWRITDLSMDVVYRNIENQATQVDCRMQLTEDRNPFVPNVVLPKITYDETPVRGKPSSKAKTKAKTSKKVPTKKTSTRSGGSGSAGRAKRSTIDATN
jgi:hypothetical protein